MLSRSARVLAALLATALTSLSGQMPVQPHAYADDFGIEAPFLAPNNSAANKLLATYYGWEATTVFGHSIWAFTVTQYNADLANNCFQFYSSNRGPCSSAGEDLSGLGGQLRLFGPPNLDPLLNPSFGGGKLYNEPPVCQNPGQACFGNPFSVEFTFTPGTEIVFALQVDQGIDGKLQTPDYNWFFSGDPSRNAGADGDAGTGFAHLAYWQSGVGGNKGLGPQVPGTEGKTLLGWEDTGWINSDWDFDNAIFSITPTPPGVIQSVTPEPATMTLLATGLTGLTLLGRRRRRKISAA